MDSEEYLGTTNLNNSMLPVFETVAQRYGGEFKNFKFDFKNNPEGLEQLRNALGNPEWFNDLIESNIKGGI